MMVLPVPFYIVLSFTILCVLTDMFSGKGYADEMQCLGGSTNEIFVLVEEEGVAFPVPRGFERIEVDSPDTDEVRWVRDGEVIAYSRSWLMDARPGIKDKIVEGLDGGVFGFYSVWSVDGRTTAGVTFNDKYQELCSHSIYIKASQSITEDLLCSIVSEMRFINKWSNLKVLSVDFENRSAVIKNELGTIREVFIGDEGVTRRKGRLIDIDDSGITVEEYVMDGARWRLVVRRLEVDQSTFSLRPERAPLD